MPHLTMRLDVDRHGGFEALKDITDTEDERIIHLTDGAKLEIGTLRGGMKSGKDSVAICFTLPDGHVVVAETSAELFVAAARGITAWQEGRHDRGEQ